MTAKAICGSGRTARAWDGAFSYTQGTDQATGFRVYKKLATATTYTLFSTLASTARTFTDVERLQGICYEVAPFNTHGESARLRACANVPNGVLSGFTLK